MKLVFHLTYTAMHGNTKLKKIYESAQYEVSTWKEYSVNALMRLRTIWTQ